MNVLVAGIGNIFLGDDGFGPEVVRALARDDIEGVTIEDYGIRGMHLAYELVAGYDRVFLIDAVPRGERPGTLYVIAPDVGEPTGAADAHSMNLENVFAFVRTIGGELPPITIIGCEPSATDEEIGLSEAVQRAVHPAADLVRRLVADTLAADGRGGTRSTVWTEA